MYKTVKMIKKNRKKKQSWPHFQAMQKKFKSAVAAMEYLQIFNSVFDLYFPDFLTTKSFSIMSADCDSYCKASKGKLKINMKKYCKKDYGKSTKHCFWKLIFFFSDA